MINKVKFECWNCREYNKHNSDDEDYEYQEPIFESFGEILNHITITGHEDVDAFVDSSDEYQP